MQRFPAFAAIALSLGLLAALPGSGEARTGKARPAKVKPGLGIEARRGLAFAQQHCSACHGVTANSSSPNPESPTFEDIANRPGLTATTLRAFLRDSHNYPAAMNFSVDQDRINDLAQYVVTLKRRGYRPTI